MKQFFWDSLAHPIIGLSPMDGITDQAFRYIQKKYGNPDLMYTEFTNVEGVCHGATRLLKDFLYDETQRPIVAQVYGTTPNYFRQVAVVLCQLGFDGIDINMGCPAKTVESAGAGAALIRTPQLAQEIILATKQGIQDYLNGITAKNCPDISPDIVAEIEKRHQDLPAKYQKPRKLPVSVKTRVGYDVPIVNEWISTLLEMDLSAIALHGRTLKQQYSGEASWEQIGKAAELCSKTETLLLGNGDITHTELINKYVVDYGVNGVLIGRGSLGNPYIFGKIKIEDKISTFQIALEHCTVFEKIYQHDLRYNFLPMRKHLGWYVKNIPNAREVRIELFKTNNAQEVENILKKYLLI